MKQHGYFLIKRLKSLNLYLWAETEEELVPSFKKGQEIVPYYKNETTGEGFLKLNDTFVRIS